MLWAHLSDIHLGYKQYNLKEREDDFRKSWMWAVKSIIKSGAEVVIIAGDLFHNGYVDRKWKVTPETFFWAWKGLKMLKDNRVSVYLLPGNHDQTYGMTEQTWLENLAVMANVTVLHEKMTSSVADLNVMGVAYYGPHTAEQVKARFYPKQTNYNLRIGVFHGTYEGSVPFHPFDEVPKALLQSLPLDYIIIGHIHSFFKDGKVISTGSLDITEMSQVGQEKGYMLVESLGNRVINTKFVTNPTLRPFRLIEVELSKHLTLDESCAIIDGHCKDIEGAVVRVSLTGQNPYITNQDVIEVCKKHKPLYVQIKNELISEPLLEPSLIERSVDTNSDPVKQWEAMVDTQQNPTNQLPKPPGLDV